MSDTGQFIVLEGIEGVGKSTVTRYLVSYLAEKLRLPIVQTREPGGTPLAEKIRDLAIESTDEVVYPDTELLLMFAARAQHLHQVILPALMANKWVVSDRFIDASYAYQGAGRGLDTDKIRTLEKLILGQFKADLVIVLDAPVEVGMARAKGRGEFDRFESERFEFFERVRQAYLKRAAADPERYAVVDASLSVNEVEQQIRSIIDLKLGEA